MPRTAASVIAGLAAVAVLLAADAAHAGKFGGFSADGTRYLDGKATVCAPVAADAAGAALGAPACADEDAASVKGRKFTGPPRLKPAKTAAGGKVDLRVRAEGTQVVVEADAGAGGKPIAVVEAGEDVTAVRGPWLSPDGSLVAVEYTTKASKTAAHAIAFDVRVPLAAVAPKPGGLGERLLKRATTWGQKQVPCEEAGVTLALGKDRKFTLTIEIKCQGSRDRLRLAGRWGVEEQPAALVLVFPNEDGPDERLACPVVACDDDPSAECIRCTLDDLGFVLRGVK